MKPPVHDASARPHSGEPSSGLGPNDGRKDRLRNVELDCEIAGLVDRSTQELRRRLLANSETHAHARETGTMYGEKRPNGWVRQSMGKCSRKLQMISGFLYPCQVCDAPAIGKRVSKSATTGGRVGNYCRTRHNAASRPVPAFPFHACWPAGFPHRRPPAMKRIFALPRSQGRALRPLFVPDAAQRLVPFAVGPCRRGVERAVGHAPGEALIADPHRPIGEPGGDQLPRQFVRGAVPRCCGVGLVFDRRRGDPAAG